MHYLAQSQIQQLQAAKKAIREQHPTAQTKGTGQAFKTDPKAKEEFGNLSPIPDGAMDVKFKPQDKVYRGRHVGGDALAKVAQRGLVGVMRLRESAEFVLYDSKPLPEGEYAIIPLSLVKNSDGMGALLTADLSTEVLFQKDVVIHNASTEIDIAPKLDKLNPARYLFIQNQGNDPMYVCYDGEYDAVKGTTAKNTTPASGVGQLLQGTGTLYAEHLMKANPRLISPSGDQTVNLMMWR